MNSNNQKIIIEEKEVPCLKSKFKLYPHQLKAVEWMENIEGLRGKEFEIKSMYGMRGGILALGLGLGKTLSCIAHSLLNPLGSQKEDQAPVLVVCSKQVMYEWRSQFAKFFGTEVSVLFYHSEIVGKKGFLNLTREEMNNYQFLVTTYDVVSGQCKKGSHDSRFRILGARNQILGMKEAEKVESKSSKIVGPQLLFKTKFPRFITDESQRFNNYKTLTFRSVMSIEAGYKWCLTGTPIRNYKTDLFSLLRWCGYRGARTAHEWNISMTKKHRLDRFILRMNYQDAGIKLPKCERVDISVELSDKERRAYDYFEEGAKQAFKDYMLGGICYATILAIITRLRQCCTAPFLVCSESKRRPKIKTRLEKRKEEREVIELDKVMDGLASWIKDEDGSSGKESAKIQALIKLLGEVPEGEKVLVFSIFTTSLDLIGRKLIESHPEINYRVIDGSVTGKKRAQYLEEFRTDPKIQVLFSSFKCGSEGLNLAEANHVVCLETWWTFAVPEQAIGRAHRLGQTRKVKVYYLNIENSIEKRMWEMCEEKKKLAEEILEGTRVKIPKLGSLQLGKLLGVYKN